MKLAAVILATLGLLCAVDYAAGLVEPLQDAPPLVSVHYRGDQPPESPRDCVLLFRRLYCVSLNRKTRLANWVAYRITDETIGGRNSIARNWWTEYNDLALESADYDGSGYSRGHCAPLKSFSASLFAWETNATENLLPQRQELNAGPWLELEELERTLAREHGDVWVVCGPLYQTKVAGLARADEPHRVPSHVWKIHTYRADGKQYVRAWCFPQGAPQDAPADRYAVELDELERRVGLDLIR